MNRAIYKAWFARLYSNIIFIIFENIVVAITAVKFDLLVKPISFGRAVGSLVTKANIWEKFVQ